jgi:hypothetical protein
MEDDYENLINQWFNYCDSVEEVAELYADLKMDIKQQMMDRMKYLINKYE